MWRLELFLCAAAEIDRDFDVYAEMRAAVTCLQSKVQLSDRRSNEWLYRKWVGT